MKTVTKRQLQVLVFIATHVERKGYAPTRRDIMKRFKIQMQAVVDHLAALVRKGLVAMTPRVARSLRVTEAGTKAVRYSLSSTLQVMA